MRIPSLFVGVRRAAVLAVATVLVTAALPVGRAIAARDPLADVQARITAAQKAADRAAAASDAAEGHYYQLQNDAEVTRQTVASKRAEQSHLVAVVRQRAVTLYTQAGATGLDEVFRTSSDVLDAARRAKLGAAANARADVAIGELRAATEDLRAHEASLRTQLADAKTALDDLRSQQRGLERALADATRAEQQLRVRLERERRANEYAARVRRSQLAARSGGGTVGQIVGSGSWVCPVQGGVSFTDTYGAPRGNGRTHKGVDMFAARGTTLVAVVPGSVFFQGDSAGGNAAYVQGNDGNTYYYAHLNDYVGGARSVSAGEVIGHVGNTGDASGGPTHLHFEIRPGGPNGPRINPYPTVRAHC